MKIPDDVIKYILFQRTTYIRFKDGKLYKRIKKYLPLTTYNWMVEREAGKRRDEIRQLYEEDISQEYERIKSHLPEKCASVLDIGCGMAGIDIFINKHYFGEAIKFYLLDKTHISSKLSYLFKQDAEYYNSLEIAKAMLVENDIAEDSIVLVQATENNDINIDRQVNLVISLRSWAFHYPVETYLNRAYEVMNDNGALILDIRKNTNGTELIKRKFNNIEVIYRHKKFDRIFARKI